MVQFIRDLGRWMVWLDALRACERSRIQWGGWYSSGKFLAAVKGLDGGEFSGAE
jgi:hypothetical protein